MRLVSFVIIFLFALLTSSLSMASPRESQLILKAKMVSVAAFDTQEVLDALDAASADGTMPTATVVFKINSIDYYLIRLTFLSCSLIFILSDFDSSSAIFFHIIFF